MLPTPLMIVWRHGVSLAMLGTAFALLLLAASAGMSQTPASRPAPPAGTAPGVNALRRAADRQLNQQSGGKVTSTGDLAKQGMRKVSADTRKKAVTQAARGAKRVIGIVIASVVGVALLVTLFSFKFLSHLARRLARGLNRAGEGGALSEPEVHYTWYTRAAASELADRPAPRRR